MTAIEVRRYEMLVRVHEFGQAHSDWFPPSSVGAESLATVAAAVAQLREQAISHQVAGRDGRHRTMRARKALLARLTAIAKTASVLAEDTPGLDEPFHYTKKQRDQALITTARAFAQEAAAFEARFVAHGMPATFVAELNAEIEALAQAIRHAELGRRSRVATRASMAAAVESGSAAVRKLEVVIANARRDDPATMADWERSRRVDLPRRSRRVVTAAPTPATPVTPATPGTPVTPLTMADRAPAASSGVSIDGSVRT